MEDPLDLCLQPLVPLLLVGQLDDPLSESWVGCELVGRCWCGLGVGGLWTPPPLPLGAAHLKMIVKNSPQLQPMIDTNGGYQVNLLVVVGEKSNYHLVQRLVDQDLSLLELLQLFVVSPVKFWRSSAIVFL